VSAKPLNLKIKKKKRVKEQPNMRQDRGRKAIPETENRRNH